jgi:pyoverdine/dityrosine biosynthesis protein Dit1
VDDSDVDEYGEKLRDMNTGVGTRDGGHADRICFRSLTNLLYVSDKDTDHQLLAARFTLQPIRHHINVRTHDSAELCRRILKTGFLPDNDDLRSRIDAQDPSTLALYRGFSRFMFEDLKQSRHMTDLSKSQRRTLSTRIAFEMIQVSI